MPRQPYKRHVNYGKKRSYRKKGNPSVKSVNRKVKKIQNMIELKFNDNTLNTAIPVTGTSLLLNGIAQGDTASQRNGADISMTSVLIKGQFHLNTAAVASTVVRCVLFYDRQANNAGPLLTGISSTQSLYDTSVITDTTNAFINWLNSERYRVIYDKRWVLNPQVVTAFTPATGVTTATADYSAIFNKKIKLGRSVKYNGVANVIGSITTNALYLAFFADSASTPQVDVGARVYFKDA